MTHKSVVIAERNDHRTWMVGCLFVAALFFVLAALACLNLAYEMEISCRRADDACEVRARKPFWTNVERFRLSAVARAYEQDYARTRSWPGWQPSARSGTGQPGPVGRVARSCPAACYPDAPSH